MGNGLSEIKNIALNIYNDEIYIENPALLDDLIKESHKQSVDESKIDILKNQVYSELSKLQALEKKFPIGIFNHRSAEALVKAKRGGMKDDMLFYSALKISENRNPKFYAFPTNHINIGIFDIMLDGICNAITEIKESIFVGPIKIKAPVENSEFPSYIKELLKAIADPDTKEIKNIIKIKKNLISFLYDRLNERDNETILKSYHWLKQKNNRKALITFLEK